MPISVAFSTDLGRTKTELSSGGTIELRDIDLDRTRNTVFLFVRSLSDVSEIRRTDSLAQKNYRITIDEKGPVLKKDKNAKQIEIDLCRRPSIDEREILGQVQIVLAGEAAFDCAIRTTLAHSTARQSADSLITEVGLSAKFRPGQTQAMVDNVHERLLSGKRISKADMNSVARRLLQRLVQSQRWWKETTEEQREDIVQTVLLRFMKNFETTVKAKDPNSIIAGLHKGCVNAQKDLYRMAKAKPWHKAGANSDTNLSLLLALPASDPVVQAAMSEDASKLRGELEGAFKRLNKEARSLLYWHHDHKLAGTDLMQKVNSLSGITRYNSGNAASKAVERAEAALRRELPQTFWFHASLLKCRVAECDLLKHAVLGLGSAIPIDAQAKLVNQILQSAEWNDRGNERRVPVWPAND